MTKRRKSFRSTVALPLLFCDLGRCIKAGARAWHFLFSVPDTALVRRCLCCKTGLFKIFGHFSQKKMTKRRERFRSTVALPVLFCDLGRCIKADAGA